MKILIAGDCHGDLKSLDALQEKVPYHDCQECIQVGDLGFFPHVFKKLSTKFRFGIGVRAIDGNHEDHEWLHNRTHFPWVDAGIAYMHRGSVCEIGGVRIGFLGGAMHVDRPNDPGDGYVNRITESDLANAIVEFNREPIDLIVTHTCPAFIGVGMEGDPQFLHGLYTFICEPFGLPLTSILDCGDHALTELWESLDHKPKHWVFGHFHKVHQSKVGDTQFTCVGTTDPSQKVYFVYDTKTQELTKGT